MVRDQINRRDAFFAQILHDHVQQMSRNSSATVFFFGIDSTDIRGQILSVMEVVFYDPHTADDLFAVQAKIPTVFRFSLKVSIHALQICFRRNMPLAVEPFRCGFFYVRFFSQCDI